MHSRSLTFALTMFAASAGALAQGSDLNDGVRRLISSHKWGEAKVGVSLVDVTSGTTLASVRGDEPFVPASNMKLLTSGAALMILGPDFVFKTKLVLKDGVLVVKGDGDPSLADPELLEKMEPRLTVADMLSALTTATTQAGVTKLDALIVDDRVFDRVLVHPRWPADQLSRPYCAQVSGINFHANVLHVFPGPNPSGPGHPAVYSLQPPAPWLTVEVRSRTVAEGNNSAWISRDEKGKTFTLRGDIRHKALSPIEVTYHEPASFVANLLATELGKAGVDIPSSNVRIAKEGADPDADVALGEGRVIAVVSTPIDEVLRRCNTDSMNLYAEALMKRMGHAVTHEPGSWTNGSTVLRMILTEKVGPGAAASTIISDGSGMSRDNAVCPSTFTRWLSSMASDPKLADIYADSLAEVGTGTLRKRFRDAKLRNHLQAKSGYISGVRTLSGYLTDAASGRKVAFSVMVNNIKVDSAHTAALELHEEVVQLADKWLTQRAGNPLPLKSGG
ncbi:MAG: D-alanyl-D-alanine carboxypeptidase/D-alanyl-D-alanine endopeptidase [Phycisphaerales bacterium]|jgi:D-alanyl-D-alanine carboxypeptidase/D-alanyl-D-alanine-endopeptidase (penicillin-binding protein 4)